MFERKTFKVSTSLFLLFLCEGLFSTSASIFVRENPDRTAPEYNVDYLAITFDTPLDVLNVNGLEIKEKTKIGLEKYSQNLQKSYEPVIKRIISGTYHYFFGYIINVEFGESNCTKGQKTNCVLKQNGESEMCTVTTFRDLKVICPIQKDCSAAEVKVDKNEHPIVQVTLAGSDIMESALLGLEEYSKNVNKPYKPVLISINRAYHYGEDDTNSAHFKIHVSFGERLKEGINPRYKKLKAHSGEFENCIVEVLYKQKCSGPPELKKVTCPLL
ncbi:uncharacterized protein LOC127278109 [Leptopilina boulardi]|uniref:uncharacterized protein LOC127278109 n=1 Tax=Leptopilina boulardi TaxID=63433 RepID=UPI0021F60755|nr:uncharacterized protein LOC127278109 [Leptopilina boulardi]